MTISELTLAAIKARDEASDEQRVIIMEIANMTMNLLISAMSDRQIVITYEDDMSNVEGSIIAFVMQSLGLPLSTTKGDEDVL